MNDPVIEQLKDRIALLVNEIHSLSGIIETNVEEQKIIADRYAHLKELYAQQEHKYEETQNRLNRFTSKRANTESNIRQLTQTFTQQDSESSAHPLFQLCQQKLTLEQQLRNKLQSIEKQNIILHSENQQLKQQLINDPMFHQMEELSGGATPEIELLRFATEQIETQTYQYQPHKEQQPENLIKEATIPLQVNLTSPLASPQNHNQFQSILSYDNYQQQQQQYNQQQQQQYNQQQQQQYNQQQQQQQQYQQQQQQMRSQNQDQTYYQDGSYRQQQSQNYEDYNYNQQINQSPLQQFYEAIYYQQQQPSYYNQQQDNGNNQQQYFNQSQSYQDQSYNQSYVR